LPAGYAYSHNALRSAELLTSVAFAQDSKYNTDFDADMLTDEVSSTG
jgi:hypothetical protein